MLPRHPEQRAEIARLGLQRVTMPDVAVDSRSLMWSADLVVGAGGTMSREAALLGIPTLTLFAGREPSVDRALMAQGRLARLESVDQLLPLCRPPPRAGRARAPAGTEPRLHGDLRRRGDRLDVRHRRQGHATAEPVDQRCSERMCDALRHRGPDAQGIHVATARGSACGGWRSSTSDAATSRSTTRTARSSSSSTARSTTTASCAERCGAPATGSPRGATGR